MAVTKAEKQFFNFDTQAIVRISSDCFPALVMARISEFCRKT